MLRLVCGVRRFPAVAVALVTVGVAARGRAAMQTTTTIYQYNADHALTAATTTVNGQSSTVYFTWDNCQPSVTTPPSCAVNLGNGNLVGVGSTPGSSYTTQFSFDQRNRLTSATVSGGDTESYTYDPMSLMQAATMGSSDALAFTYDAGALPALTNIQQASSDTWASYLGSTTYLSSGTEQTRCQPRKDVAGVYEAAGGSFSPLRYDPYGIVESASSVTTSPTTYDLSQNPLQYEGEYTDPVWSGVYLRTRWYFPQYQTFIGRDPADAMHRYGYAAGNPIDNIDPSGLSYGSFSRATDKAFRWATTGAWGYVVPWVPALNVVVGGVSTLANLPEIWHHPTEKTWLNFGFLVSSAVVETAFEIPAVGPYRGNLGTSYGSAFFFRHLADVTFGAGQAVLSGYQKGHKLDVGALLHSIDFTVGSMLTNHDVVGVGYRPYDLSVKSVNDFAKKYFSDGSNDDKLLLFVGRAKAKWTTPITDVLGVDFPSAHTQLNWLGKDSYGFTDLTNGHAANTNPWVNGVRVLNFEGTDFTGGGPSVLLRHVGTIDAATLPDKDTILNAAYQRQIYNNWGRSFGGAHNFDVPYSKYTNNCQHYVHGMTSQLTRH